MNCIICRQADLANGFTSITFERDEFKLLIHQVPAEVCPNCSEAIVNEEVVIRLLTITEELISEGIFEAVRDYAE